MRSPRVRLRSDAPGFRRTAVTVIVVALLAGATAAFALTEALKLEGSLLTVRRFDRVVSPECRCPTETATFVLRLRDGGTIDAAMIDAADDEVRVLATGLARPAGRLRLRWDGTDDEGRAVPPGRYRLRVRLRENERTIVIPRVVVVRGRAGEAVP